MAAFLFLPHIYIAYCSCFSLCFILPLKTDFLCWFYMLMKSNGYLKIPYIYSQFKLPTETLFKIFVSLEMIGHLKAGGSLKRTVGRSDSLSNVSVNSDYKLCFQPCLLPLPCKVDTSAMLEDSLLTIAVMCHVSVPFYIHCFFCPNSPYNPHLINFSLSFQVNPNTTTLMILWLPMCYKWLCIFFIFSSYSS